MNIKRGINILILAFVFFAFPSFAYADETENSDKIAEGIYAGDIYIGEKTEEEARAALEERYLYAVGTVLTLTWQDTEISVSLAELGLTWDLDGLMDTAMCFGKTGSLIQRYKTQKDLKYGTLRLEFAQQFSEEALADFVSRLASANDIPAIEATIKRKNGGFDITEESNGLVTNPSATIAAIKEAFENTDGSNLKAAAVVEVETPTYTKASLSQIKDVLGSSYTVYNKNGTSSADRKTNVEVATKNINGKVINPGESASTSDMMKERTQENGYRTGTQFVNGQREDAIGGGVCQVSTTLYNALLKAELKVNERSNHSMVVSYVDPGKDAAIADGSKDLVFTNNTEYPVLIEGYTDGTNVTFMIYGVETRPANRTVEYKATTTLYKESNTIIQEDATKEVGYESSSGSNSPEVDAYLEKIVYVDGVEVERTTLHNDHYIPSYRTVVVGTKAKSTTPSTEAAESTSAQSAQ